MRALLAAVADGSVDPDEAALRLKTAPFTDLGYAKVDHQRGVRQGVAEVVYGAGKTPARPTRWRPKRSPTTSCRASAWWAACPSPTATGLL